MPKKEVSEDSVGGTSEGLRLLIAAGADDQLLDRFMRAKVGGDEVTAESILSQAALLPAAIAQAIHEVRIPPIADTHSNLIADSVPGDRGHPGRGA